jgi:hypothetical protein
MIDDAVTDLTRGVYRRLYSGFTTGQRINKISLNAEAWFWRVVATVDDFGNGRADPDLCKDATAGRRRRVTAKQIAGWLKEMADVGLISFYSIKGELYLHVFKFEETQPAGKNGKRLKRYPTPDDSGCVQVNPELSSASDNDTDTDTKDEYTSRGKSALVSQVFEFWKSEMKHTKAQLTADRKRKIEERLADSTVEEIQTAIRGCKASDFHMGRQPGHAQIFDDIELICRKRSKLEAFIALAPGIPNGKPKRVETIHERQTRESCELCHGTGTEITAKGAKNCEHGNGISNGSGAAVEGPSQDRGARIS